MADFNALEALINAYIKQNGVQAITGQVLNGVLRGMVSALGKGWTVAGEAYPNTDPGTMTGPVAYVAHTAGTYTNFGGLVVNDGEVAFLKYNEQTWTKEVLASLAATASVDGNVGTPYVVTQFVNGVLNFAFHNMKGDPGINGTDGQDGAAAGFGTVNATVDGNVGTPGVSVQSSGPDTAKNFTFQFTNLKGETGVTSVVVTVDNTSGNPQCTASLNAGVLTLAFTGLKGAQGDTGSSVDYPFTLVNNLTTNDATQALTAAMGVQLESEITQLEANQTKIFPYEAKQILVDLLKKVAYIDNDVAGLVADLEDLLLSEADLVSITAVFTPGAVQFHPYQSLDDLKPYLEVTGYYDDLSEREITNYTLSGSLTTVGTNEITVSYGGKTTTFNVTVVEQYEYKMSDGDLTLLEAATSWNSDHGLFISLFSNEVDRRRSFVLPYGQQCMGTRTGTSQNPSYSPTSDYFPIPIPADATSVQIAITPTARYFGCAFYTFQNGEYTRVLDPGWVSGGSQTYTFTAGQYAFMTVTSKYDSSGTSYPTNPTELTITFNNE